MIKELYEIERTTLDMVLDEASKKVDGEIAFRAPAMLLDQFTKNRRRYSTAVMEKALARITDGQGRTMFGSAGHVDKFEIPDISHRIDRLWIDKKIGALMVEGVILPTTRGKDLAIAVKAGKLGLSLKGTGTLKAVEEGKGEDVQDDYKLNGIDFTLSPSCDIAMVSKANLYESVDFEDLTDDSDLNVSALSAELDEQLIEEARLSGCKKTRAEILGAIRGK